MSTQAPKPPWADEPTPLCDESIFVIRDELGDDNNCIGVGFACDLERRLRLCQRHLKWVSRCATMAGPAGTRPVIVDEYRMEQIKDLVKRMEQDGKIPLE